MRASLTTTLRALPATILLLGALGVQAAAQARSPGAREQGGFEELARGFAAPPWDYAPYAFWFWDVAPPDPDVVETMARRMIEVGMNPGYVHARPPIVPEFPRQPTHPDQPVARGWLGEEWFEAFDRVVAVAAETGAQVGFCDDVWWPSLRAAGRVLARHPELRAQTLLWTLVEGRGELEVPPCEFAVAVRRFDENELVAAEPGSWIAHPHVPQGPHRLHLRRTIELPADRRVTRAELYLAAGGPLEASIDGFGLGPAGLYRRSRTIDVTHLVQTGAFTVELEVDVEDPSRSGARSSLRVHFEAGAPLGFGSDQSWSARLEPPPQAGPERWTAARVLPPAAALELAGHVVDDHHRPAVVESETLTRIGGGEAFTWSPPDEGIWRVYAFTPASYEDVNRLDLRVGPAFVEIALEPYLERYAERLGSALTGVFVDNEGDYGVKLAWSEDLVDLHSESTGRDLRLWLPLLIDRDVEGRHARARFDWFRCVSELYTANYGAVVDRLERAGLHAVPNFWEESLLLQATHVGDAMALLRRFTLPGNDCLQMAALDPRHFAEARSVAELGGRRFMTEFMGAGRWQWFDPMNLKRATNSILASGVSHVVPHGVFLNRTLTGSGWTPDWYDRNPMFRHLGLWSEFTRRASFVNAHGRARAEVLLLNPQESIWAVLGSGVFDPRQRVGDFQVEALFDAEALQIERSYAAAIRLLSSHHVEFLVGDRTTLEACELAEGSLSSGEFTFHTLVLPHLTVLPLEIARKLVELARSGGRVLALGPLPRGSTEEGLGDPELAELMAALVEAPGFARVENLARALEEGFPGLEPCARVVAGSGPARMQRRLVEGRDLLWLANLEEEALRFTLLVPRGAGRAAIWDCEGGTIEVVGSRQDEDGAWVELELAPLEALWLSLDPAHEPRAGPGRRLPRTREVGRIAGPWRARIAAAVQPHLEVEVELPRELTASLGSEVSLVPWSEWGLFDPRFAGHVDYGTSFELAPDPAGARLWLDLGLVHDMAEVLVNGQLVGTRLWPPHRVELTGAVRPGTNELVVRVGNLVQNNYLGTRFGFATDSGLIGPVRLLEEVLPDDPPR